MQIQAMVVHQKITLEPSPSTHLLPTATKNNSIFLHSIVAEVGLANIACKVF